MPKYSIILTIIFSLFLGFQIQASTFSDGTLIKASGPEVYVLEHGIKRWIVNPKIFGELYYRWDKIIRVTDEYLAVFPPGNKIDNSGNFPDGALLKSAKSPKVYLSDQGRLRWIPNPDIFNSNNFSWENILLVSDNTIKNKAKESDVKSGEFVSLPTTRITDNPPAEIDSANAITNNYIRVIFRYSGTNPEGPVSELSWETFLDGYDSRWQQTLQYSRTIDLPGTNKSYKFYVRSRNKSGKVDPRPAFYSFEITGFSPLFSKLKIDSVKSKGSNDVDEYIKIINNSKEKVDIAGLSISNKTGEEIRIPKGAETPYLEQNDLSDIILEKGNAAIIFSGFSPVVRAFRINKCTGYFNLYKFSARLPEECPRPLAQDIADLSKDCRDYINSVKPCGAADLNAPKIKYDSQCQTYLINNLSYGGCVNNYRYDPDFFKSDWYVFLDRTKEFWNNQHDEAKLTDQSGNFIDSYSY